MRREIVLGCLFFAAAIGLSSADERLAIGTYYPGSAGARNQAQSDKPATGDTEAGLTAALSGETVYNAIVEDMYYQHSGSWVPQTSGKGCYVSFTGMCLAGFANSGSLGQWGRCQTDGNADNNFNIPVNDIVTNSRCAHIGYSFLAIGTSAVCCKE